MLLNVSGSSEHGGKHYSGCTSLCRSEHWLSAHGRLEDRSSLGKIGLVKSLVSVHERRPVVQNQTLSGTILGCYRIYSSCFYKVKLHDDI